MTTLYQEEQSESVSAQTGETLVEVDDLKTYYGSEGGLLGGKPVKAVDGVNFDVHRGETLGLVGESGCGKSTLGRTLMQLENATAGEVRYDGTDITTLSGSDLKQWRQNVQMVFQDPDSSLNGRMTVGEIIMEPLNVHNWKTPQERRQRVRELLDTVGLSEEHYYRYPFQFSGGQKQRVGIARALALEPDFIVLDEPVSALDVSVQAKVLNLLDDLQEEFGLTYLLIAHDLSVVEHICDRVAVMYLGNIMEIGPVDDIFDDPANPYTQSLLSAIPEPDPNAEKNRMTLRGTPPSPRDPPTGCVFSTRCPSKIRPEQYRDIDDDVWEGIEIFREVLRERGDVTKSVRERVRDLLGMETRGMDVEEVIDDAFGELDVPSDVQQHVDEAVEHVERDDLQSAQETLRDEFGSVCESEEPETLPVGDTGRTSRCHRHREEYESSQAYLTDHFQ
ncbi:ABC transporter ATP-binding protein [Halobacterium litoreum]|uniref:ABC transporter ATP-binding protein n=1 Tax=Halobacterium litoreum TaxID=2039234 RepID=A0ABD5NER3_9EURY|nr:oligopeptide/dipeptide ABC transporter ATP-binding protein [Halobacterium litoreum]UHH13375.1 ATP-binding cassette domain-containing protein [Halobacterium litoreum]